MNDRQERFAREYVIDGNATQAAIRAGYSAKTAKQVGHRLLTYADVRELIDKLKAKVAGKLEITAEKVLRDLENVRIRCMQEEPVFDSEGNPTGEYKFAAASAIRASELQGKHIKMFTDVVEVKDGDLAARLKRGIERAKSGK